jgi:hypothetical protein
MSKTINDIYTIKRDRAYKQLLYKIQTENRRTMKQNVHNIENSIEYWKPVKGYDLYECSNNGRIRYKETSLYLKEHKTKSGITVQACNSRLLHVIIWQSHRGEIPKGYCIKHKNGNKHDNRLNNLTVISRREINVNKENKTTLKGVYKRNENKYQSIISIDKIRYSLGCYKTAEEASTVYRLAEKKLIDNVNWRPEEVHRIGTNKWAIEPQPMIETEQVPERRIITVIKKKTA